MTVLRTIINETHQAVRAWWPHEYERLVPRAKAEGFSIDDPSAYCHRCGASAGPGAATVEGCAFCLNRNHAPVWQTITRLSFYDEPMRTWIKQMKFQRSWAWATWFGKQLAERMPLRMQHERTVLCPVPMHWLRKCFRGYNQSDLIARAVGKALDVPVVPLLRRTRHTNPQTSVPYSRRHENIAKAITARPFNLRGWTVWLIDDVKTSGATLSRCTMQLKKRHVEAVHAAVVTVADPRGRDFTAL